jgi:hypothetical protein
MAPEVLVAAIGALGTLGGVVAGGGLGWWTQKNSWKRERVERLRSERLSLYSRFLAAVRDWRAAVLEDNVTIVDASRVSRAPHADGGESAVRAYGLRDELGLVAESGDIIEAARTLTRSVRFIAEARAQYGDSLIPVEIVNRSRDNENHFLLVARRDLGTANRDDVDRLFPTANRLT